jgi:hypothetical protein
VAYYTQICNQYTSAPVRIITARGECRGGVEQISAKETICAALGSPLARALLAAEIEKFPPLAMALDNLQARAPGVAARAHENLCGRWLEAHQLNVPTKRSQKARHVGCNLGYEKRTANHMRTAANFPVNIFLPERERLKP